MEMSQLPTGKRIKKIIMLFHGFCRNGELTFNDFKSWTNISDQILIVSPNGFYVCGLVPNTYQWFAFDFNYLNVDLAKLQDSTRRAIDFINSLLNKYQLKYSDLFLVGYSQGAIFGLYLTYYVMPKLAGTIAYSGSLPTWRDVPIHSSKTPTLLIHGTDDFLVPINQSVKANDLINSIGGSSHLIIDGGNSHAVSSRGVTWGRDFIIKNLNQ